MAKEIQRRQISLPFTTQEGFLPAPSEITEKKVDAEQKQLFEPNAEVPTNETKSTDIQPVDAQVVEETKQEESKKETTEDPLADILGGSSTTQWSV